MPISSQVSDMLPHYHDTLMLLKKYRDIAWIVEVSSRNLQEEFRAEYGCPGRDVLNSLALNKTDASLMDCSQSLEHSAKMLHIIDSAVDLIREKHKRVSCIIGFSITPTSHRTNMKTAAKFCALLNPKHLLFHCAPTMPAARRLLSF